MRQDYLILLIISSVLLASCASSRIKFQVYSNPSECPVDVDGVYQGVTPIDIFLDISKQWVGIYRSPDGWSYGKEQYQVTCYPPPASNESLVSQSKIITPRSTPRGGEIFFNLKLTPVHPTQPSEIIIKDDRDLIKSSDDPARKLKKLKQMKEDGLINDEEYEQKRKSIIDKF